MIQFIETLTSLGWCMIRRWTLSSLSSMFCIPLGWVGREMIGFVGCPKQEDLLWSNPFTRFFFLMLTPLSLGRAFEGLRLL
jgi:hypothetical protein